MLARSEFEAVLAASLSRPSAADQKGAVLVIDVAGVDRISGALGFAVAEELMAGLGAVLVALIPEGKVARFAEHRFVAFRAPFADRPEAVAAAAEIIEALHEARLSSGLRVQLSVNVGILLVPGWALETSEVLRDAHAAVQDAVLLGPDRFAVFEPESRLRLVRGLELEDELMLAFERAEFEVHFQPIVARSLDRVAALEALVRWRHPTRGLLAPAHFLATAERSGLIGDLGDWILDEVCSRIAQWRTEAPELVVPPVSINVSMARLYDLELAARVEAALARADIPASSLILEITETAAMQPDPSPYDVLGSIAQVGVGIWLDDFGTGYSSLSWLARLPIAAVKVDRSFIGHVISPVDPIPILTAVTQIARDLGILVIAEGIERPGQMAAARLAGVDGIQGFLVARPIPVGAITELRQLLARAVSVA